MRDRLIGLLEKADLAAAAASGVVEHADFVAFAGTIRNIRDRLASADDVLVVALMGGTGSGKSSLFNAICGGDLAEVGGVRPTTGAPLAAVAQRRAQAMEPYLDSLGIAAQVEASIPAWLCLIDMPDTDSVELDHRFLAESLLGRLDLLVWVVDPEKYRDAALHDHYLKPLAAYADQFLFVLNQVDRLGSEDAALVQEDLVRALEEDGLTPIRLFDTSASPAAGPPLGIAALVETMAAIAGSSQGVYTKLVVDLTEATHTLVEQVGVAETGLREKLAATVVEAAALAAAGDTDEGMSRASEFIESVRSGASAPFGDELTRISVRLPSIMAEALKEASVANELGGPSGNDAAVRVLAEEFAGPIKELLAARAAASAALVELSLGLASLRPVRSS